MSINVAIAGVGNCASNFIQGLEYYKNYKVETGLMHRKMRGYDIDDIKVVAAFDVADGKVNRDLSEAIYAPPNCTNVISNMPYIGVSVKKGIVFDGWNAVFNDRVSLSNEPACNIESELRQSQADILLIMLPTGSNIAVREYALAALKNGISVINGVPVLITRDEEIMKTAINNKACIIGDDFKSQLGGTILHNTLLRLLEARGINIKTTYQLNYGGNMDFLNLQTSRGIDKHKSKKEAF